jgi:hypothetical protein
MSEFILVWTNCDIYEIHRQSSTGALTPMGIGVLGLSAPSAVRLYLSELGQELGSYFCAAPKPALFLAAIQARARRIAAPLRTQGAHTQGAAAAGGRPHAYFRGRAKPRILRSEPPVTRLSQDYRHHARALQAQALLAEPGLSGISRAALVNRVHGCDVDRAAAQGYRPPGFEYRA